MTAEREELAERLRYILSGESVRQEKPMFGTRSFLVNGKLLVSALRTGGLLVRVDAARHQELLWRPGAARAEMGAGREMGPGWIEVAPAAVDSDEDLLFWVDAALDYNRRVTG